MRKITIHTKGIDGRSLICISDITKRRSIHIINHPLTLGKKYICINKIGTTIDAVSDNGDIGHYALDRFGLLICEMPQNTRVL